jgi:surface protein
VLNNNDRVFGEYSYLSNSFENELSNYDFVIQYNEYLKGLALIKEKTFCTDPVRMKELDLLIDTEGRELDKFIIRAMAKKNISIISLDTSNITDLSRIFENIAHFNQDISTKIVHTISSEPNGSYQTCSTHSESYVAWNVRNVKSMFRMFFGAKTFNQNINMWDVSNVDSMAGMFKHATQFNSPLNSWDVSNVKDMYIMFREANNFNQPLDKWNISNVNNMDRMFDHMDSFEQYLGDWKFNTYCKKPMVNNLTFDQHNEKYQFTKDKLMLYIDKYITSLKNNNDNFDEIKYQLMKFLKQYREKNETDFIKTINEIKFELNQEFQNIFNNI